MPDTIDLSGTPYEEECAQIGRDPGATERSRHEALAYKAALIAALGEPPTGYRFRIRGHEHDFGTYYTAQLVCPDEPDLRNEQYEELAEGGLRHWHQAMMPAPYDYSGGKAEPICQSSPSDAAITRAIIASRPSPDGSFALEMFGQIHARLTSAFPDQAAKATSSIALIHSQEGVTLQ
jgi:hypothetical protein